MNTTPSPTRALITGLTGQDGYYLAQHLIRQGCRVTAGVRPVELELGHAAARELGVAEVIPCELDQQDAVEAKVAQARPDRLYHLAAQSSVGLAWRDPVATCQVNAMGTLFLLEALRKHAPRASFVMAGSCDCYDHEAAGERGVTPQTPLKATNPYAVSKVMAHQMIECYRQEFGLNLSVAILFNHTSERRPEIFVERGIVRQAVRVSLGLAEAVTVGNLATRRDWAWAPELMAAFAAMGAMGGPEDMVLASGQARTVGDWVSEAFGQLGLDHGKHLRIDPSRLHPGDRQHTFGNIEATRRKLGWAPRVELAEMVRRLIAHDVAELGAAHQAEDTK
jgi:GDPmannose 4,6-dehydratase